MMLPFFLKFSEKRLTNKIRLTILVLSKTGGKINAFIIGSERFRIVNKKNYRK